MPCRDDRDNGSDTYTQDKLDKVTRQLCRISRKLEKDGLLDKYTDREHTTWWNAHKEADEKRLAAEAAERARRELAANARAKLTPEERTALGIR